MRLTIHKTKYGFAIAYETKYRKSGRYRIRKSGHNCERLRLENVEI
jgi:hypothetical protein